ncbi:hypothetical protein EDD18DRAFT_1133080, partial [Armillaria luteobubalina]
MQLRPSVFLELCLGPLSLCPQAPALPIPMQIIYLGHHDAFTNHHYHFDDHQAISPPNAGLNVGPYISSTSLAYLSTSM